MGNFKSKKVTKDPSEKFFDSERVKERKIKDKKLKNLKTSKKRKGIKDVPPALLMVPSAAPPAAAPALPSPAHVRNYDTEALERMRHQLNNDADAFLLNNILLGVQFFENYERETHHIKNNPISDKEQMINDAMVRRHKHVFFADRLQECVHEHVGYRRQRGQLEPIAAPRLFVIYDNMEASEPGDTSDYSAVLDAPFYKLGIEDCKEPGYVKLKKIEILESNFPKENGDEKARSTISDDSIYPESVKESNDSDDDIYKGKGEELLQKLESKLLKLQNVNGYSHSNENMLINNAPVEIMGRRQSGPTKLFSSQVEKSSISNLMAMKNNCVSLSEEIDNNNYRDESIDVKPRKSILKNIRRPSGPIKEIKGKQLTDVKKFVTGNTIAEDTETSGYRSSETESDYGYSTITQSTTPKKIELSEPSNYSAISGVLPDECWCPTQVRVLDYWSEDEEEEIDDSESKTSQSKNLYETYHYLGSLNFMNNFVDNFIINLGSALGLTQEAINNALTQGASVYCDSTKNGSKMACEVYPALIASWPNAANQWIIRERRIIQNPRTNFTYQWPTKYMVSKAIGAGCMLVPVGFRPKRRFNPEQVLQWRIIFPAAERYLESCLAHSHVRCYLFALALHKTFLENESFKTGIDTNHIKNHLFWQCEDNYAQWPEDRLGETLRLFLRSFYIYFGKDRFPNYFIDSCNDFKGIPKYLLRKCQKNIAQMLESPVMHMLKALDKIKYTKKDFYPKFNCLKLYEILTCKNPLRLLNPNLPVVNTNYQDSSEESDNDNNDTNIWDKAKSYDKNYKWNKEWQRQVHLRRKAQIQHKKDKEAAKQVREIDENILLPRKLETERRRLVLELFIPHFIAMARSSERFETIRQAVIYLEQAQRLCILLSEEPGGDTTANEYLVVVRDKLADCQRKLVNQGGFKLPRRESQLERSAQRFIRKQRARNEHTVQDTPTDVHGISAFTFVDVHVENSKDNIRLSDNFREESKL